jgi:hypothetical protein
MYYAREAQESLENQDCRVDQHHCSWPAVVAVAVAAAAVAAVDAVAVADSAAEVAVVVFVFVVVEPCCGDLLRPYVESVTGLPQA